jgi:methionine salvage enolase-phosphatase E1
MGRPTKKEINLTKESMLSLMQEIYNELVEQRNTAIRIQNKMLTMMKEPEDMTLIGHVIEKQQKIINDCVDKKLSLSKLQAQIWQKSQEKQDDNFTLSDLDLDDDTFKSLIDKDTSTDNSYKLNK